MAELWCHYGTEIGPVLKYWEVLATFRAGAKIEAQKNPPGAGPSGLYECSEILRRRIVQMLPLCAS